MSGHGRRGRGGGGHGGGGGGHGGWLVTYADLLTLLMVLFLVLWVISQIDLKKFEKFKEGLGDFGNPAAAQAAKDKAAAAAAAADTTTTSLVSGDGTMTADGSLTGAGLNQLAETVQEAVNLAGLPNIVSVSQDERGLVITLSTDDILFQSGSAALNPAGVDVLAVIAPALQGFNNNILVGGHTDKRPLKKAGYDNWDLSFDRAGAVVKLLKDHFGLPPERLSGTGYGDTRPIAVGDDAASLAKNRRVEIVVLAATTPAPTDTTVAPADTTVTETTQPVDTAPVVVSDTEPAVP